MDRFQVAPSLDAATRLRLLSEARRRESPFVRRIPGTWQLSPAKLAQPVVVSPGQPHVVGPAESPYEAWLSAVLAEETRGYYRFGHDVYSPGDAWVGHERPPSGARVEFRWRPPGAPARYLIEFAVHSYGTITVSSAGQPTMQSTAGPGADRENPWVAVYQLQTPTADRDYLVTLVSPEQWSFSTATVSYLA